LKHWFPFSVFYCALVFTTDFPLFTEKPLLMMYYYTLKLHWCCWLGDGKGRHLACNNLCIKVCGTAQSTSWNYAFENYRPWV